jgi:hypothetical protein
MSGSITGLGQSAHASLPHAGVSGAETVSLVPAADRRGKSSEDVSAQSCTADMLLAGPAAEPPGSLTARGALVLRGEARRSDAGWVKRVQS